LAWEQARVTLRFAGLGSGWPDQLDSEQVGVLSSLAALDSAAVRADSGDCRIEKLAAAPGGAESFRVLNIALHCDTLRSAAPDARYYRSSIQSRLASIESATAFR
jgi:hypothetical protein